MNIQTLSFEATTYCTMEHIYFRLIIYIIYIQKAEVLINIHTRKSKCVKHKRGLPYNFYSI